MPPACNSGGDIENAQLSENRGYRPNLDPGFFKLAAQNRPKMRPVPKTTRVSKIASRIQVKLKRDRQVVGPSFCLVGRARMRSR